MVKNGPQLEIYKVVLIHFNVVNSDYQHDSKPLYLFVPHNALSYQIFHPKMLYF